MGKMRVPEQKAPEKERRLAASPLEPVTVRPFRYYIRFNFNLRARAR